MLRTRVIPCLLLRHGALVKTVRFANPSYIGDPINAIRIYNELEVDELIILDIAASVEQREPPFEQIEEIASECFMPVCYGGGIRTLDQIKTIFGLGIEKVAINTRSIEDPSFIRTAAERFGSQSIVASIDARREPDGTYKTYVCSGSRPIGCGPAALATRLETMGVGEILVTSIDRDGTMQGYDLELIRQVTSVVGVPVVACGGAGRVEDFGLAVKTAGAAAVAAGSMVVYFGRNRAVLINFPERSELEAVLA